MQRQKKAARERKHTFPISKNNEPPAFSNHLNRSEFENTIISATTLNGTTTFLMKRLNATMNRLIHIKLFCLPTHFSFQFSQSELIQRLILKDCPYFDIDCHSTQQLLTSYVLPTYTPYCDLINHSYKVISLIIAILYPAPVLPYYRACPVMTGNVGFFRCLTKDTQFFLLVKKTLHLKQMRNEIARICSVIPS